MARHAHEQRAGVTTVLRKPVDPPARRELPVTTVRGVGYRFFQEIEVRP